MLPLTPAGKKPPLEVPAPGSTAPGTAAPGTTTVVPAPVSPIVPSVPVLPQLPAPDPTEGLARRLRLEREARGWSLAELAARSGVSKAMISKIERDEVSPTAALLGRTSGAI